VARVLVCDPTWDLAAAAAALAPHTVEAALRPEGDDVAALLVCPDVPVGARELALLPGLRVVATNSTGFDHLAVQELADAGVWACAVAGYCDDEVAEHTIALVCGMLRGVTLLDRSVRQDGAWTLDAWLPRRIAGTSIGIVGLGRIGRRVAALAGALGMHVLGCDPALGEAELAAAGVRPSELDALLAEAEVVTLHVPLTAGTAGLLDARRLADMRPGALLVNCSRAQLVDAGALERALRSGAIAGYATDVLPVEPPLPAEPALTWPATVITPHAAYYSPATAELPYRRAEQAVAAVLRGDEPADALARPSLREA